MPALSTLFCDFFIFCGFPTTSRLKYAAEYGRIAYEIKPKQELPVNRTLTPDFMFARAADITPEFLHKNRIRALLCDIDNTLSPYEDAVPNEEIRAWVQSLREAGIAVALISNNTPARVETYNAPLGLVAYADAKKPSTARYLDALRALGTEKNACAVLGDQLLTDCWSARRLGVPCIIVPPIRDKKTLFFRCKRALEKPFLAAYRRAHKGENQ